MKSQPAVLSKEDSVIKCNEVDLDEYTINFNELGRMSQADQDICYNKHPHTELLQDMMSTKDTDSDSSLF